VSACSAPIRDTEAKLNTTAFALPFEMKSGREEYKWLSEGISINLQRQIPKERYSCRFYRNCENLCNRRILGQR